MRLGSIPWRVTRYSLAASARLAEIATFASSAFPALSEYPVMTAVAFRSFFIRRAIPSRTALAMLVKRALPASKKISSLVVRGVGGGGAVVVVVVVVSCCTFSSTTGAGGAGAGITTGGGGSGGQAAYVTPINPPTGEGENPCRKSWSTLALKAPETARPVCPM